jgi:hypothetical protein
VLSSVPAPLLTNVLAVCGLASRRLC